ncbi:MAG: hypothetical protein ACPL3B_04370 [Fervidobacterium sp.]
MSSLKKSSKCSFLRKRSKMPLTKRDTIKRKCKEANDLLEWVLYHLRDLSMMCDFSHPELVAQLEAISNAVIEVQKAIALWKEQI